MYTFSKNQFHHGLSVPSGLSSHIMPTTLGILLKLFGQFYWIIYNFCLLASVYKFAFFADK